MDLKEWELKQLREEKYILEEFDDGEEQEEEEETLSLCDLALSISDSSEASFKEDQSSSYDQGLFEFFSQTNNSSIYPKDTIIFCGKLIRYKGELKEDENYKEKKSNSTKKSSIFPWKSYNLNIARSKSVKMQREKSYRDSKSSLSADKCDFRVKKWYSSAFGAGGRYPAEMELKDIKTRQSKIRSPARETKGEKREKNNWWGLLRILGCQSSHANAMVKASFGLMPEV